jgi:hypothetical protein
LADIYFRGYDNSTIKPGNLLIASIATAPRAAWLRSGGLGALTLPELQAVVGDLVLSIDGVQYTATIDLSAATSWSEAAQLIADALTTAGAAADCAWDTANKSYIIRSTITTDASAVSFAEDGAVAEALKLRERDGATRLVEREIEA